jgi:hypothetical protein
LYGQFSTFFLSILAWCWFSVPAFFAPCLLIKRWIRGTNVQLYEWRIVLANILSSIFWYMFSNPSRKSLNSSLMIIINQFKLKAIQQHRINEAVTCTFLPLQYYSVPYLCMTIRCTFRWLMVSLIENAMLKGDSWDLMQHTFTNSGFKCSPDIRSNNFKFNLTPTPAAVIWTERHGALPIIFRL